MSTVSVRQAGRGFWPAAILVVLCAAAYVGLAALIDRPGFPLDDAWIHQTYARNFARSGRWEYLPGVVSAGSTAPLWTLLLAMGYALRVPYLWWSYLLGAGCFLGLVYAGMALWRHLWPEWADRDWLAGLALATSWPFVWAAVSGMETLLFMALGLAILAVYTAAKPSPGLLGVLTGLLILTRPEGVLLLFLIALAGVLKGRDEWRHVAVILLVTSLLLLPYFLFNLQTSGHWWPNTFYAKQQEYRQLLLVPLPSRLAQLLYFSLGGAEHGWRGMSGAHLLLLPGVLLTAAVAARADWRMRHLRMSLPLLWAGGHVALYAWRLPVTYQHGRYLWAAIPIWILAGLAGWALLLKRYPESDGGIRRLARQVVVLTYVMMAAIFLLLGAQAYATDVAFVEGEMVAVAGWLREHTDEEALIAAHDIGAIGYFTERPLLDLAGLISPDVIPLLRDESALARHIYARDVDYLVTAPGWRYPLLTDGRDPLYTTAYAWTRVQGYNNMTVYQLSP